MQINISSSHCERKRSNLSFLSAILLLVLVAGCGADIFPPIGTHISSPNEMAVDSVNNRLYLINSNSNVLYNWHQGTVQILDLTDPTAPELLDTIPTLSFSGEAIIDATRKKLYTSNRFSEGSATNQDQVLTVNIDEASTNFKKVTEKATGINPYGLFCCYPADRLWISNQSNDLDYIDLGDSSTGSTSLLQKLSDGSSLTASETIFIAVKDNQAFLPRIRGGLLIVNLDEADDPSKNAVNYWIDDLESPSGIATDGTYVYVVDEEYDDYQPLLLILDPSSLPPLTDNTTTKIKHKGDDDILVKQITVTNDPQKVFLTSKYAFVTCFNGDGPGVVAVIDLTTKKVTKNITVGKKPFGMAMYAPGGVEQYLYVGNVESNIISIIDLSTLKVVATYP